MSTTGPDPTLGTGPAPAPDASATAADPGATTGTDPASAAAPPNRRTALMRSGLIVGVLILVFVVILPQFVSYSDVVTAFQGLSAAQIGLITILGVLGWIASGLVFSALIEGLSALRGTMSWLILSGIGSSVPFGPWNMGVLWVVIRGWGVRNAPATSGIALYGVVNELSRLFLPLFGVLALALTGELSGRENTGAAWAIAILSIVAFLVVTGLIIALVRSERVADWLGRTGQRIVSGVMRRLGRTGSPDVAGGIRRFRDQLGEVIRRRGLASLLLSIVSQFAWTIVLVVSLRMVGVPDSALGTGEIFAVYGLVMVITIIPLSPGGAGVPELLFITWLSALAGPQYQAEVTAGVFLYRIYFWFVPIPLAWILLKLTRRGLSMLPTTAELRAKAAS
jgi:uncharacterized membrane protein YbhN (UPF0104 family)